MVIALTTNPSNPREGFASAGAAILWKTWQESRGRFFSALVLLASVVIYAVITSPGYLAGYDAIRDKPLMYSA